MNLIRSERRKTGAYYTPNAIAEYMAEWLFVRPLNSVLEPSAGDGAFLKAVLSAAKRSGCSALCITAVELSSHAIKRASSEIASGKVNFIHSDFLLQSDAGFGAVIGNPPFVRLRHLPQAERMRALCVAADVLGHEMDPSGSIWMPFVLHASRRLRKGGRLAMVLPLDATYVRYARPLWRFLSESFSNLRVVRVRQRLFPDLSQDVVLLFADGAKGNATTIRFEAFADLAGLTTGRSELRSDVNVSDVIRGERAFLSALLEPELRQLLEGPIANRLVPAGQLARFRIGYVAGDKEFFHPARDTIRQYDIRRKHLIPTIASARNLTRSGLFTSGILAAKRERLFLPNADSLSAGDRQYIRFGEKSGVAAAYKCRVRSPWYKVPYVMPPDIVMSVFSDRPLVAINDSQKAVSNSFLCATILEGTREAFVCRWYNSLTLLQCELNVHSLGGGVFVLVPREAAAVKLLASTLVSQRLLKRIDSALKDANLIAAYESGDGSILRDREGLSSNDIELIQRGVATLRMWRNPSDRSGSTLAEQVDEQFTLLEP